MKIFYSTFGCKVNQYETENIREALAQRGHEETAVPADADVCIVNTCTVTAQADSKCRQMLHRLRKESPNCVLVCAGCMTQALKSDLPECDIIAGSHNKQDIPDMIEEFLTDRRRIVRITQQAACAELREMHNSGTGDKTRAYIKIQDGCDMNCTYCIIPRARGHIRSKPPELIKKEAEALIAAGHREIILTGINLCCYGLDRSLKGRELRLIDAVETVCGLGSGHRVRLSSLEPELISESDIRRFASLENFCRHFHLSLQSGCDKTLAAMKRHYDTAEYRRLCESLRASMPDCTITTDIMVGFPCETEEDHRASMDFVRETGFAQAHIFPYSARPDTPAALMPQVDGAAKKRRAAEMAAVCKELSEKFSRSLVGSVQSVLFENERSPEYHSGHSAGYIEVRVPRLDSSSLRYQIRDVEIIGTDGAVCLGRLL